MQFDEDILEKARTDASLRFWNREVSAEVSRATQDSSQDGGLLAALGFLATQDEVQAVTDRLVARGFSDFLDRAPGIEPYFRRREESVRRHLDEVVRVVNAHEEQIIRELLGGRRPTRVTSMNQASFTYRGGRSVLIITTDVGRFLYKPHTMRYNAAFSELCERLLPGRAHVPRVVDCGDASLSEFIESVPPANDEERGAYYEGLGGYLALAYFLSLTDQHVNNILPVGPKFAPIDVETLLLASPTIGKTAPEPHDPALSIRGSVASTGMLSYSHDRLTGPLVAGSSRKGVMPIGTSTEAVDHLDVVAKGFAEAFRTCLESKGVICEAISSLADVDLRIFMAPGSFYQSLQSRFFELEGWDEESRLRDMGNILISTRFKTVNQAVCAHERAVLAEFDIPYFTVKGDERDLRAEGDVVWKGYLAESLVETAIRHVEETGEETLEQQLGLLRKLVGGMPLMSKTRVPDIQPKEEPLAADAALEEAGRILRRLYDERVDCGHAGHAMMAFGFADGNYGPMDASLGWGYAGVGVFAAACERLGVGGFGLAGELAELCLDEVARNGRYLRMVPEMLSTAEALSLKTGLAGQLRALQLMWSATRSDKARQTYADLLALLDAVDFSAISDPSALVAVSELEKVLSCDTPGLPSCGCLERIDKALCLRSAPTKDDSHARHVRSEDENEFALRTGDGGEFALRQCELTSDSHARGAQEGLTAGAPAADAPALPLDTNLTPSPIRTSPTRSRRDEKQGPTADGEALQLQERDDLKGGNAGVVEQLISSGQIEEAGLQLAATVARCHETGNYIHKGAWRVPYFDPTLFHGATGVGYELLRYARPDVIEPLFS